MRTKIILIVIAMGVVIYSVIGRSDPARRMRTEVGRLEQAVLESTCPPADGSTFCHYMVLLLSRPRYGDPDGR